MTSRQLTSTTSPVTTGRQLRDYQQTAVHNIYRQWEIGNIRTVIVHATGLGKTDIIAKIATDEARQLGPDECIILLGHLDKTLDQMTARCELYAPDITVGRVQAEDNEIDNPIIVAMVQTLRNHKRMAQFTRRPVVLIIDECHHAAAESYTRIMEWAGSYNTEYPCRTLGVTATLVRGDGKKFGGLFTSVADVRSAEWGIAHGWLVKPFGRSIQLRRMILDSIPLVAGDWSAKSLGGYIEQDADQLAAAWLNEAENRITAAFCPTVASTEALRDALISRDVAAELVVGATDDDEREAIYGRLATGVTRVLVNVMVAAESFDCPAIECIMLCRPTKNPGLYMQMVGRGLRPFTDVTTGYTKEDCLVLDVVGVSRKHKIQTLMDMYPHSVIRTERQAPKQQRRWWHRVKYTDVNLMPESGGIIRRLFGRLLGKD